MALSLENVTISAPDGTSNQGNPQLLCTPSSWTDVAAFIFANFVAHAATVKSSPGEPTLSTILSVLTALSFPTSGVLKGLISIHQRAILCKTSLQTAVKAQALCMVVRSNSWKPCTGDQISNVKFLSRDGNDNDQAPANTNIRRILGRQGEKVHSLQYNDPEKSYNPGQAWDAISRSSTEQSLSHTSRRDSLHLYIDETLCSGARFLPATKWISFYERKLHGVCKLPAGYELALLPPNSYVTENREHQGLEMPQPSYGISSSYNLSKGLIAIFQLVYSSFTLYNSRGNQLQQYGFASFGLTVTPYLVMSMVNLASTLLTPEYSTVFMVKSEIMGEASRRGGIFDGVVGSIEVDHHRYRPDTSCISFRAQDNGSIEMILTENLRYSSLAPWQENDDWAADRALRVEVSEYYAGCLQDDDNSSAIIAQPMPNFKVTGVPLLRSCRLTWESLIIGSIPIAIIGGLSGFKPGHSTYTQRVWILLWLVFGILLGPIRLVNDLYRVKSAKYGKHCTNATPAFYSICFYSLILLLYSIPAIVGVSIVVQMLREYGYCVETT